MSETSEIVFLAISLVLSCFYSGSEAALISIPLDRLKHLVESKDKKNALNFLLNKPNAVMNTILLGNNLVNIIAASLMTRIFSRHFDNDALAISVGVTTALILIFGEIIPKTFARVKAESLAVAIIRILQINYLLFYPAVKLITFVIERILGKNALIRGRAVSRSDIEYMVNRAEKERSIDSKQIHLLNSILEFPKIKVKDIMVIRNKVVGVRIDSSFDEVIRIIKENGHSRYPVYNKNLDHIEGFLHVKDLSLVGDNERKAFKVKKYLKPPFFIYEHMKIQAVFDHMNRRKVHLALVKDENGLIVGIITLEDIMEEIFGEIVDEHDQEEDTIVGSQPEPDPSQGKGDIVAGSILLRDLNNTYGIEVPLNDNYSTLTGFLLEMMGNNFPEKGQIIFWEGYSFQILKIEDHLIKEVLITKNDVNKEEETQVTA
ncbi:MAG: hemolysin family protein [Bacteriovoracales bacterium]|nr:hemolysin family protein [Bacteriovoracales bacterium]